MEQYTIQQADSDDASLVARIIRESFRDVAQQFSLTPENCPKHPSNCDTSWITSDQTRGVQYFIVFAHDTPVGCVGLEKKNETLSFIERLAVLPQHRRRGLGQLLVRHVISQFNVNSETRLSAAIIAGHTELKEWFKKLGFAEVETRRFEQLPFEVTFLEYMINKNANKTMEATS